MIRSLFTVSIIIILSTYKLPAQQIQWGIALDAEYSSMDTFNIYIPNLDLNNMCMDINGNIYIAGEFQETANFNPNGISNYQSNKNLGTDEGYIAKYNSNGNLKFIKHISGGDVYNITTDSNGYLYIVGTYGGSVDFETNSGFYTINTSPGYHGFIAKYDTLGNFIFVKQLGDYIFDVCIDQLSNIYVAGQYKGTQDFDPGPATVNLPVYGGEDLFFCKLTSSGDLIWAKGIGGASDDYNSRITIATDSYENVFLMGNFRTTIDFDPGIGTQNLSGIPSVATGSVFLGKYNTNGDISLLKKIDSCSIFDLKIDASDNLYFTGYYLGSKGFDPDNSNYYLTNGGIYFAKFNNSMVLTFAKAIGGQPYQTSISIDSSGYIYLTGECEDDLFDPASSLTSISGTGNGMSMFFGKFSPNGDYINTTVIANQNLPNTILSDKSGNIYISGVLTNTADFDPGSGNYTLSPADISGFIVKYSPIITGVKNPLTHVVKIFPNPSSDGNFKIETNEEITEIDLVNILGRTEVFYTNNIDTQMKGILTMIIKTKSGIIIQKVDVK